MDEESYRYKFRNHFMDQVKNSKLQASSAAQHYKEQILLRNQQKTHDYEPSNHQQSNQRARQSHRSSGGDADRVLYESANFLTHNGGAGGGGIGSDTYRSNNHNNLNGNGNNANVKANHSNMTINTNDNSYMRQLHIKSKAQAPIPASLPNGLSQKIHQEDLSQYMYDTDSNMGVAAAAGGICIGSDDSEKSGRTSKTVVSKVSSRDLRKRVKSQCKLHEVIDETLKQMCASEVEPLGDEIDQHLKEHHLSMQKHALASAKQQCQRCTTTTTGDRVQSRSSQKDVTTEIAKGDFLDCRPGDTLTISVDDVVNSKVINPMIRKLQRMYLNNLREEMSLMEDLERLPHKVNEVYKATIFKQKE